MSDNSKKINFKNAATYRIVVDGILSQHHSKIFPGLMIKTAKNKMGKRFTTLIGEIKDQAELSGILNNLYDMRFTVIAVNMLSEMDYE